MKCEKCGKNIVMGVCGCGKRDIRELRSLEPQFRTFAIERSAVNEDKRTVADRKSVV